MTKKFRCYGCGKDEEALIISPTREIISPYYGVDAEGHEYCPSCAHERDVEYLRDNDKVTLYLTNGGWSVQNWAGTIKITPAHVSIKPNGHNWGLTRRDVWFTDMHGNKWWGFQLGENSELLHCKKLK